jgi:hypothetical protein
VPTGKPRSADAMVQWALKMSYYPLLLFFAAGLYLSRKRWRDLAFFYMLVLYYAGMHAIMLVVPRYRFPLEPLMAVFAAFAAIEIFSSGGTHSRVTENPEEHGDNLKI